MVTEIKLLGPGDERVLARVADGVFDETVRKDFTAEFLTDPRHHICVALDQGVVVGFASAVYYLHPDKPPQLWINEVAVAPPFQRHGVAKAILARLADLGRELGCTEAWVLTDHDNTAARALYKSAGGVETTGVVMVTFPFEP